eukprot:COSAG02_NODE_4322_length_5501_cov_5.325990_8_plen_90_part_00
MYLFAFSTSTSNKALHCIALLAKSDSLIDLFQICFLKFTNRLSRSRARRAPASAARCGSGVENEHRGNGNKRKGYSRAVERSLWCHTPC